MKTKREEKKRILYLEGRIDSQNAAEVEKEILEAAIDAGEDELILDADRLEYISSAGLRILMRLRKQRGKNIPVVQVSTEIYDIFEVTGFVELLDIQKKLRQISVEGCERLGQGGNGTVYRLDEDTIVKVYKPWMRYEEIERERMFAKTAFVNGIPSVIAYDVVQCGESYGVVFEMLKSDTLGHEIGRHPEKLDEYVDQYVALAKTLHSTHVPANTFTDIRDVLRGRLPVLETWCSKEEIGVLERIIDSIPDSDTVTHNDLHPGNIMIQDGELVLIDMPEVTMGPPIVDLVGIYRDMISAPRTSSGVIEYSVGMPSETIIQVGQLFFKKYTGITDEAKLEEYFKKLGLLYAFNVVMIVGTRSENAVKRAPMIMDNLLRAVVIPNEQTICHLFATM